MSKRIIGVLLAGFVVAGCGSSGGSPEAGAPAPQPVADPPESARKAPDKATDIADKCSILNQQQQQQLGISKPPEELDSNGHPGCRYQHGELGSPGWGAFVSLDGSSTFDKQVKKHRSKVERKEIAGYPVAVFERNAGGCMIFADTSDNGFMFTNLIQNSATDAPVDLCQQAEKVTEAALQNVPNA